MQMTMTVRYVLALTGLCSACNFEGAHDMAASKRDASTAKHDSRAAHDGGPAIMQMQPEGIVSEFLDDAGDDWVSLVQAHWVLPANAEAYRCVRVTVTRDVALHALRPITPLGTHHNALTLTSDPTVSDGFSECSGSTNEARGLGGSGVGTNDFVMPDGVAIRLHEGEQLLLNLHLFNVGDEPLEGTSGFLAQISPIDDVVHEAEQVLAGPLDLEIPAGQKNVVQSGKCTFLEDATVFAVAAHAHMAATYVKAVAESSIDGTVVLRDAPFSFDSQTGNVIKPVHMKAGDTVNVSCTYDNLTDHTIGFGNSSLDEMCFAVLWRYPRAAHKITRFFETIRGESGGRGAPPTTRDPPRCAVR
jgi:hypothetical protein